MVQRHSTLGVIISSFAVLNLKSNLSEPLSAFYRGKRVLVTGGASFIGSHLVDALISLGANVRVVDDLSSGKAEFVNPNCEFIEGDLADISVAQTACKNIDVVFNLAAVHGGRGFIETQHRAMLKNFSIDNNVFTSAFDEGVSHIVHASSACAYPVGLQKDETGRNLLSETQSSTEDVDKSFPDGVYGWIKLMGEFQLQHTVLNSRVKGRSARIFTAYGDRENESHAAIALIAKGLLGADPYPVWGNGLQTRNFTYVSDTVTGLLFLGSDNRDVEYDVFNIGTDDHVRVIDFINEVFEQLDWEPEKMYFDTTKPTGVASRASDNNKISNVFGWAPAVSISEGISRTLDWYKDLDSRPKSLEELELKLMAR